MSRTEIAKAFLRLAAAGRVHDAYEKHIHPQFIHHNAYFKGDRGSLLAGMEANAKQFPDKTFEALRVLEDGDLVAIHGKVTLSPASCWSVIHIFRFDGDKIIEAWEASQEDTSNSPNENGIF